MAVPTCPTNCATALPAVSFSNCAPEINLSEIVYVYVAKNIAADFTDWEDPAEWATRLSQSSTTGDDYIRTLTVIADKPAPQKNRRDISGGRSIVPNKTHTLNVTIDETNDTVHGLVRVLECNGLYKIWYETLSGHRFGGNEGIKDANLNLDLLLNRGQEEIMTYGGTIEWKSKFTEERTAAFV